MGKVTTTVPVFAEYLRHYASMVYGEHGQIFHLRLRVKGDGCDDQSLSRWRWIDGWMDGLLTSCLPSAGGESTIDMTNDFI